MTKLTNIALEIVTGDRVPWEEQVYSDSDSDSSGDEENSFSASDNTELKQLFVSAQTAVTSLMRISTAIHEPAPSNQSRCIIKTDKSIYEPHDIQHVQAKFPESTPSLVKRLGRAISSRRQYLSYREEHHRKLSEHVDLLGLEEPSSEHTTASTEATALPQTYGGVVLDEGLETISQTSYAPSVNDTLRTPRLPEVADKHEHYECPLCFSMIAIHKRSAWK